MPSGAASSAWSGGGLESRTVTGRRPGDQEVIALYRRAFPEEEQTPLWHMRLMSLLPGVALRAWYDGEVLAGLTYTVESRTMVWLFYLAVNDSVRSRGYGSRILEQVRRRAVGRPVVLEIEPVEAGAPNLDQRRRRLAFYQRNGFTPAGCTIHEGAQRYTLMSDRPFDAHAFSRMVRRFFLGVEPVHLSCDQG
ncbi:GNAT family N-acetyltransferase [Actinomyces bowdenii]|uniref:GNAT family N-acetyltransferase n=1 Tax=Actinomyces bowdenii TaxID=131109 RepID=UPI00214B0D96|nr:GNAT family N-acetyltransferase [Actinomyces bowdenii]MCR2051279.1 GNAT family N-acetyltransferase [Actinomyces bowdenii]